MEEKSEIVIRITPKNLERLIYILVIVGLIIISIVGFSRDAKDCPKVECEEEEETVEEVVEEAEEVVEEEPEEEEEETTTNADMLSGNVDFLFTAADICTVNETEDKGRFDSITIYIKNGLKRQFNGKIQLYLWDEDETYDVIEHKGPYIDDIRIMSGATYSHQFTMDGGKFSSKGYFTELAGEKKIKASLIDDDINEEVEEVILSNIKADLDCE